MRIVVFGGTGNIGREVVREASSRGLDVTLAVRKPMSITSRHRVVLVDVFDPLAVRTVANDADAVISAIGPRVGAGDADVVIRAAGSLLEGLHGTGVRLIVVGGAGSLKLESEDAFVTTPESPGLASATSPAGRKALDIFRADSGDVDWVVMSPPLCTDNGKRTGNYQTGTEGLLRNDRGVSRISRADFAVALLDEVEQPLSHRTRVTVAYL